MLTLRLTLPDGTVRLVEVVRQRLTIGRQGHNGIVISDSSVSREHAALERVGMSWFLSDLRSDNGTWVNNERAITRLELSPGDVIQVGRGVLKVVPTPTVSAEELMMVKLLQAGDATQRDVYADWLEARGSLTFAQYVRAEQALHEAPEPRRRQALAALSASTDTVDARSRALVSRAKVENCHTKPCPGVWDQLAVLPNARLRQCHQCSREVTFCDDVFEARALVAEGERVVVEVSRARRAYDLMPLAARG